MAGKAQDPVQRELIDCVVRHAGISSDKAELAVEALVTFIETRLAKGEAARVRGLGKFAIEKLEGIEGINPATGVVIMVPARNRPVFLAAKSLKDAVNK